MPAAKTAMDIVLLAENMLGFCPQRGSEPLWKTRSREASKLAKAMANDPSRLSAANLAKAISHLQQRRRPLTSILMLVAVVDDALAVTRKSYVETQKPVAELINEAVTIELAEKRGGHEDWVARLLRSSGDYRTEVYGEWLAAERW